MCVGVGWDGGGERTSVFLQYKIINPSVTGSTMYVL